MSDFPSPVGPGFCSPTIEGVMRTTPLTTTTHAPGCDAYASEPETSWRTFLLQIGKHASRRAGCQGEELKNASQTADGEG
jgi:hypothetical protein